jgi:hypothetical protein
MRLIPEVGYTGNTRPQELEKAVASGAVNWSPGLADGVRARLSVVAAKILPSRPWAWRLTDHGCEHYRKAALERAGERLSIVISLTYPDRDLLPEAKQRQSHQGNSRQKEDRGAVDVLQMQQGGTEAHDKQQRCTYPCSEGQARRLTQEGKSRS